MQNGCNTFIWIATQEKMLILSLIKVLSNEKRENGKGGATDLPDPPMGL